MAAVRKTDALVKRTPQFTRRLALRSLPDGTLALCVQQGRAKATIHLDHDEARQLGTVLIATFPERAA